MKGYQIGQRWAEDDMEALDIAQGVENAGGEVLSISYRGSSKYETALIGHAQYVVWFRLPPEVTFDTVDAAIAD